MKWEKVEGPPPKMNAPRERPVKEQHGLGPARPTIPVPRGTPPPPGTAWPPPKGDSRLCLRRPGNDQLTDCGRLLFFTEVGATDNEADVTCTFCLSRIKNGTARVLH